MSREIAPVKHIPVNLALSIVKEVSAKISSVMEVPLSDAIDKVLAEDIVCRSDSPSKAISHYDGYAVRSIDTVKASSKNPLRLKVVEESRGIEVGEAMCIRTGFPMPDNADSVIPLEAAKRDADQIYIHAPVKKGFHVISAGAEARRGERLFKKGHILRPQDITLLSKIGYLKVKVYRRPRVSVIAVGDELTKDLEEVRAGKILETHGLLISSLIRVYGGDVIRYDIASDDVVEIMDKILESIEVSEIVVTIGGASVGVKDLVPKAVAQISDARFLFRGVRTQPGKMTGLAMIGDRIMVMLPGNIQSTFAGSYFILQPLIRFAQNLPAFIKSHYVKATLSRDVKFHPFEGFMKMRFFKLERHESEIHAKPLSAVSWLSRSLVDASGFAIIPPRVASLKSGTRITVRDFPGIFNLIDI